MSLDVYLTRKLPPSDTVPVRVWDGSGGTRELTRKEWESVFPNFSLNDDYPMYETVYSRNITNNLYSMAKEAGFGEAVWEPESNGIKTAHDLIAPLEAGIKAMRDDPERFKPFSASNGWGTYEQFLPWLEEYLQACREYPDADVSSSS